MDRNPGRLIEQLQNAQLRQRKVIQQLQADNTRLLGDLLDICQERDAFREEAACMRRENAEFRNRLEEALTKCQDLKRERATPVCSATIDSTHVCGLRITNTEPKIWISLSVLNEGQTESAPIAEPTTDTAMEKAASPKSRPHLHRELPDPLKLTSPRLDRAVSTVVTACSDSRGIPTIQASLCRDYSTA